MIQRWESFLVTLLLAGLMAFSFVAGQHNGPRQAIKDGTVHDVRFDIGGLRYQCDIRFQDEDATLLRCGEPKVQGP